MWDRIKYYNNCLFHNVQKDFLLQTGDPTGTGKGGDSVFKYGSRPHMLSVCLVCHSCFRCQHTRRPSSFLGLLRAQRGGFGCRQLYGEQARCFEDEIRPTIKHIKKGMVGMASQGRDTNASQFYITTGEEIVSLDGKHTVRIRTFPAVACPMPHWPMHPMLRGRV